MQLLGGLLLVRAAVEIDKDVARLVLVVLEGLGDVVAQLREHLDLEPFSLRKP